ncbi:hypothetical protein HBH56_035350 [Parastagonospora nodorum]|uniref:Uncharacterized protein n=1 Tax=Phaeosphaeria nodorum (strain SN15 / ATCC MYA-4574 / FGSC 10173) TaxID=321614 RepID=A0A7U2F7D2_PHANO|nr:hypothetical protein HBH56_035350 [Parastagonospora nodorum]QRD00106.1 hypothetical protein JI435_414610 [Parastagonospora nodorum SN15]KAH3933987.1 hypothetical protein HBH54_064110 [Parastagonospora nodorum]KAH3952595.1 hypothetical protein HBH53_045990 [Parastagonospora nodorum]KAH3979606.1 hypothetical protein HBH51_057010 [Parastagonospora nodorum]
MMYTCEWARPQEGTNQRFRKPTTERGGNRDFFEQSNAVDHPRLSFNKQQGRAVRGLRRKVRILRCHDRSVVFPQSYVGVKLHGAATHMATKGWWLTDWQRSLLISWFSSYLQMHPCMSMKDKVISQRCIHDGFHVVRIMDLRPAHEQLCHIYGTMWSRSWTHMGHPTAVM